MMVQLHCAAVAGRVSPILVSAECKSQSFDMRFAVAWVLAAEDASNVPALFAIAISVCIVAKPFCPDKLVEETVTGRPCTRAC